MPKPQKHEVAASMTIHRAGAMTKRGRASIAAWMRRQAKHLERHGDNYASRFRASFRYY